MESKETTLGAAWGRLGLIEVWGRQLLWFAIISSALLSLSFDAARLNNFTLIWLPVRAIAFLVIVIFVTLARVIAKRINVAEVNKPLWNLSIAGLAMGSSNAVSLLLTKSFGIQDSNDYSARFLAGAGIGVSLLLIYSNLRPKAIETAKDPKTQAVSSINFSDSISPVSSTLLALLVWLALKQFILREAAITDIFVCAGIYLVLLALIKLLIKPLGQIRQLAALLGSAIPGLVSALPVYFLLYQVTHTPLEAMFLPSFLIVGAWSSAVFSQVFVMGKTKTKNS
jgi:hypothetical protein